MKKLALLLVCAATLSLTAKSQNISIEEGKKIAKNIIEERFSSLGKNPQEYTISNSFTETFDNTDVFHVYNLEPAGFVIVSASENIEPLLAFSYESSFDKTDRHPSVQAFLDSYAEQIAYSIKNNLSASEKTQKEWQHYKNQNFSAREIESVSPLLSTKWNQGRYFNTLCPEDSEGLDGHAVTGCVATALGQIFNYFRYPTQGTGSYGYDHETYGHLEVNFEEQRYDYDYMPNSPTDYNENLARLLYNIGVSVDMQYGPDGSGMYNHKGAYTMYTHFGYCDTTRYIFKDSLPTIIPESVENDTVIPDSIWNGILVDHLNRRIPLYYAGWGDYVYQSGHAFVFDGYSDSTHYHINWGWGGSYDGFFTISNLSPGGSNFRLAHEVIINAVPKEPLQACEGLKTINFYEGSLEDGSGPLDGYFANSNCSWLVTAHDSVIGYKLNFERFDIDETDNIIIYEGDSEEAPIVATIFGGDELDSEYTVNSTSFLVKFISDETVSGDGWLMSFKPVQTSYCRSNENLSAPRDTIEDGSGRWQYNNSTYCRWNIDTGEEAVYTFQFLELDTEEGSDFVKILKNGQLFQKFSGNSIPETISFVARTAAISFTTNSQGRGQGFKLVYSTSENLGADMETNKIAIYPNPASTHFCIEGE
ncbi:MAG: C10 family peptidase, partial [Bacteroidales bacterium]|nr:C10 family peptidase [Bacteroidales bacterium]